MNWNTFIFASYEMLLTIVFSLLTVFITKKILSKTFLKNDETKTDGQPYENLAISIFSGMLILCMLLLVNTSIRPAVDILNVLVMTGKPLTLGVFLTSFGSFVVFFIMSIIISSILLFASIKVYMVATVDIDEMKELKAKNVAVAIIMSIVLLGITISVKSPLERFIFSMVNYEKHQIEEMEHRNTEAVPQEDEGQMAVPQKKISPKKAN